MIFIIGIMQGGPGRGKVYRILLVTGTENGEAVYKVGDVSENDLKSKMAQGLKVDNADLVDGTIIGATGSLNRFEGNGVNNPFVVISEIRHINGNILGYRLVNIDGTVKSIRINDVIKYCKGVTNRGGIPLQNGAFVDYSEGVVPHIRSFKTDGFPKEIIGSKAKKVSKTNVDKKDVGSNLQERFNEDQIKELKTGKLNGIDIRIYADEKLSAEQMQIIREGLEKGIKAEIYADSRFTIKQMIRLQDEISLGYDVSAYASPIYNLEQMEQIKLGVINGIDTNMYANPKTPASEMEQIRVRLENGIWCDCEATKLDVSKL